MMGYWGYGDGGILGGLLMLLFWVVLIILIVSFFRRSRGVIRGDMWNEPSKEDTALSILRERFAKGEINKDEFEERKKSLQ